MKTIKFSDSEIDLLTQLYLEELDMAENYVKQIKAVLKKLDVSIKPVKEEAIEQEPRLFKRREIKTDVKTAEKAEPKKRGRKPRVTVPSIIESLITAKKEVKEKIEPIEPKKRGRRPRIILPITEALPVASSEPLQKEEQKKTKRGRKPKLVVPTPESAPVTTPEPVKKEEKVKAAKPKKTVKTKVKAEKKPVAQRTRKPKSETKAPATVESVVASLLTKTPKKKEAKVAKKKPTKKRSTKGKVTLANLSKPITTKSSKVEAVAENAPVAPTEQ